ncbi:flagellar basal-body rod protein FlgB [Vulcanibacillus modesticaldus]|uniref:Flagellar basal body rod protein FlgB n=1 Tax=Vulcanibacillus modesticaldus TaxID=337097 RepID=A0A1D2YXT7_9BACI|nr:flagellar basal body rod protein FlgB [Vulcanibacillus modesticaldus]OEG00396.1 flagellar basal-body rod protein FlgB [Vulcanibacillus modesticaldus]
MKIFSNIDNLQRSLDISSLRQRLISNNIANVDTPGYKTMDVSFDEILAAKEAKYLDQSNRNLFRGYRTDPRHLVIGGSESSQFQPKIVVNRRTSVLNNDNNVDIDYEMTKLAENNIWYNTLTQVINKEFSMLRYVITEGRR